jgi:TonB-linked SusC/RagA family outer membrane protein
MKNEIYKYLVIGLLSLLPLSLLANTAFGIPPASLPGRTITGRVTDTNDIGMIGATVRVKGTNIGAITAMNGHFTITVPSEDAILEFTSIGYETKDIPVRGLPNKIKVILKKSAAEAGEVVITAFGSKKKKESVVSAISTVRPAELRVPSSNLTQAFAGRLPGVIAYQRSGEPGQNNAQFFIRGVTSFSADGKKDPLILVDGIEMTATDLSRLNVDDIESFSILKDATSAALYGARGANGVILITTKEGTVDKIQVSLRVEDSRTFNSKLVQLADPITFMNLYNEAVRTRDPMVQLPYALSKIRQTKLGSDPVLSPIVDWYHSMIAKTAPTQRVNLNITGGGQSVQYFLSADYQNDKGILKEDSKNLFHNNINVNNLQVRSNVTIKFSPTTSGVIRAYGSFQESTGPGQGGAETFEAARNAIPTLFLPYYPADSANQFAKHILFGNGPENNYVNPLADELSSYKEAKSSLMLWQLELSHRFTGKLDGLTIRGMYNIMRKAAYSFSRGYTPFYYFPATTEDGSYQLLALNPDKGTEYLTYSNGPKTEDASQYGEVHISYNKTINTVHSITGTVVGTVRNETVSAASGFSNSEQLKATLPQRNISLAGSFSYGYKDRYFAEFDFGYNGSERFAKKNRYGFFPAAGVGWMVSSEPFMSGVKNVITELKLRATYGLVGNDQIGSLYDRFFYLSQVDMDGTGYWFGTNRSYLSGIDIVRYPNPDITWEIARKTDIGIDLSLFNDLSIIADAYWQTRSNILQTRSDVPTTMGLQTIPQTNVGMSKGGGFETTVKYQHNFGSKTWVLFNGNFTYASAKYKKYEEPDYSDVPWRSRVGTKLGQPMGYIAERLFIDQPDLNNSPTQELGTYLPGDIKYKDINGDGVINSDDIVPIGFPTVPEIIYGFGFTLGYGAFDLSCFFQGSAESSFFISPGDITPFINQGQRGLLKSIADDHWSENNRNIYAFWPRLSASPIENNDVASTHWLRNGQFVRFKSAELGYTLPETLTRKVFIQKLRFYASALNLFVWSKFKMWDPEMAGDGLGYPIQRVINVGVKADF